MPPLPKPNERDLITLPPRPAISGGRTDVLVVGGGPAGLGAAYGAATAGARVILAERYGFLGGNATVALVTPLMSYHTDSGRDQTEDGGRRTADGTPIPSVFRRPSSVLGLMPNDHGVGQPVIAGVLQAFLEKLIRAGGAIPPSLETGYVVPFDPEIFKLTALDLLDEAGVQYLFHAFASGIVGTGRGPMAGPLIVFETKSGPVVVAAKVIVDCTGDGDIAASAGAAYEMGREEDGLVQPMTLMFRMVEFRYEAFHRYAQEHPGQWHGVYGLWDLIRQATEAGELQMPRENMLFFGTPHEHEVSINSTRVTRVFGTDVWDLTYAEGEGRRQMRQVAAFLRRYVPGFEEAYLAQSGVQIGVRETRRILGEYQLTAEDLLNARKFEDSIARGSYPIDIHSPTGQGTVLKQLPPGESYDIPLRCLIPRRTVAGSQLPVPTAPATVNGPPSTVNCLDHLLVAGRCISGTHEAQSSYRTMPTSMATGQAAGVCAVLAVRSGWKPRDVPAREVRTELLRQGANLG